MGRKGLNDPMLEAMRQTIERQSGHLERIVDDLLDVDRQTQAGEECQVDEDEDHIA